MKNRLQIPVELKTRLSMLSKKEEKILQGLFEIGHVDQNTLESVLDAGDLSNNKQQLSAFAISFLALRAKGVPVPDVIRMSRQQNRRINLWWSPQRWENEHQKLSRFETLKRLASENQVYDMTEYQKHLPDKFPGYLITGSRRLGMEGLRQRHCVASWHSKLSAGLCAICCVFIEHTRWTVELFRTGNDEYPIRIGQIRSTFNKMPTSETRQAIRQCLNIREPSKTAGAIHSRSGWRKNAAVIIPVLVELGATKVKVSFSGYGDSGQIDEVQIEPEGIAHHTVTVAKVAKTWADGVWLEEETYTQVTLDEALTELCYDYLEATGVDYVNNEGGQGNLTIDVPEESLSLEVETNYTQTETAFSSAHEFSEILTETDGEELTAA